MEFAIGPACSEADHRHIYMHNNSRMGRTPESGTPLAGERQRQQGVLVPRPSDETTWNQLARQEVAEGV